MYWLCPAPAPRRMDSHGEGSALESPLPREGGWQSLCQALGSTVSLWDSVCRVGLTPAARALRGPPACPALHRPLLLWSPGASSPSCLHGPHSTADACFPSSPRVSPGGQNGSLVHPGGMYRCCGHLLAPMTKGSSPSPAGVLLVAGGQRRGRWIWRCRSFQVPHLGTEAGLGTQSRFPLPGHVSLPQGLSPLSLSLETTPSPLQGSLPAACGATDGPEGTTALISPRGSQATSGSKDQQEERPKAGNRGGGPHGADAPGFPFTVRQLTTETRPTQRLGLEGCGQPRVQRRSLWVHGRVKAPASRDTCAWRLATQPQASHASAKDGNRPVGDGHSHVQAGHHATLETPEFRNSVATSEMKCSCLKSRK